jgi:hypothetical protein
MMGQLIRGTPWWAWVLLALLVQRGIAAARPNAEPVWKLLLLPLAFSLWSAFSLSAAAALTLGAALMAMSGGVVAGWLLFRGLPGYRYLPELGMVQRPGTWRMLLVSVLAFCIKYMMAAASAYQPTLLHSGSFILLGAAMSGLSCGLLWGAMLTQLQLAHRSPSLAPRVALAG